MCLRHTADDLSTARWWCQNSVDVLRDSCLEWVDWDWKCMEMWSFATSVSDLGITRIEMAKHTQPSHRETYLRILCLQNPEGTAMTQWKPLFCYPQKRRQKHSQSTAHARKLIRRYTSQKCQSNCNCNWHIRTSRKSTSQVHFTIE